MTLLWKCGRWVGIVLPALVGVLFVFAGSAEAAFPGRDGLLAVQPLTGSGIVLIGANGRGERRICARATSACGFAAHAVPRWSSDGQTLVVDRSSGFGAVGVIYPDGSCLDCDGVAGVDAAPMSNPTLMTAVAGPQLTEYAEDGLIKTVLLSETLRDNGKLVPSTVVSDPVWSSGGELALVRDGSIWVGGPGNLRRLTSGRAPSWSPDGKQIVFRRSGWLMIAQARQRSFKRLVAGRAPAWSPNGAWIAFIGKAHRLSVVRASGGAVRTVGKVTGTTVDWQPIPARRPARCLTPPRPTVIASDRTGKITADTGIPLNNNQQLNVTAWAYMGCLRSSGRERLLARYDGQGEDFSERATSAAVSGTFAALVVDQGDPHYGGSTDTVDVFDLRTGALVKDRGGQTVSCPEFSECGEGSVDGLVLNSQGFTAVHTAISRVCGGDIACSYQEQIQAADSSGVQTVDSATMTTSSTSAPPPVLTNLALNGDTLTWDHNGVPESTQLH